MQLTVPIGQYVPGTSLLHRLDARLKLLVLTAYCATLFLCGTWPGLLLSLLALLAAFKAAGIPLRRGTRGLKPILFILAFTFLAHALGLQAADVGQSFQTIAVPVAGLELQIPQSIAIIGGLAFKPLGALEGLYFVLRIVLLVCSTTLLTFTTSIVALTDALTGLLRPLRPLKVPTEDIAMMFSIALRFIPLTASEAEKLVVALTARGVRFNEGGLVKRCKAYMPVLVPLFVSLFKRADKLALAMESRCYSGAARTRLDDRRLAPKDTALAILCSAALLALGIAL